jgi:hypothetical protein
MEEFKRPLSRMLLLSALILSGGLLPNHNIWAQG